MPERFLAALLLSAAWALPSFGQFGPPVVPGHLANDSLAEASGLAASRRQPGVLWSHNDSGDGPRLFAFDTTGRALGTFTLRGIDACDWEDLALGPGPDGAEYLYVGDLGSNSGCRHPQIIRVRAPDLTPDAPPRYGVLDAEVFPVAYPGGAVPDVETLLLDPLTRQFYLVTKEPSALTVLRAPFPADTLRPVAVARMPLGSATFFGFERRMAVGGDIAPSGLELLLRTYDLVLRFRRSSADASFFDSPPDTVATDVPEPQGEAIAWAADGGGFFTVGETVGGRFRPVPLYFYPRRADDRRRRHPTPAHARP